MEKALITTKQLLEKLQKKPNNEYECRRHLGGILFSTHWFIYNPQKKLFGDSSNWFHYDGWYSENEFLECYANSWWDYYE